MGLYRELKAFLGERKRVTGEGNIGAEAKLATPVVTILSRKGGVGKSMFALATALSFVRQNHGKTVCIVDLDLTGPVWQYLLFPQPDKPARFLNDWFEEDGFFREATAEMVADVIETSEIASLDRRVKLLSLADLPRTNRSIALEMANRPVETYNFLVSLVQAIQPFADLIVFDNSPGFATVPLLTHVLASKAKAGTSIVVSTPAMPDLRGTIVEISDLRLLDTLRPPLWVINKATPQTKDFLANIPSVVEAALALGTYDRIVPDCRRLASKVGKSKKPSLNEVTMPLDNGLHTFSHVIGRTQHLSALVKNFEQSLFYRTFKKSISPILEQALLGNEP